MIPRCKQQWYRVVMTSKIQGEKDTISKSVPCFSSQLVLLPKLERQQTSSVRMQEFLARRAVEKPQWVALEFIPGGTKMRNFEPCPLSKRPNSPSGGTVFLQMNLQLLEFQIGPKTESVGQARSRRDPMAVETKDAAMLLRSTSWPTRRQSPS